VYCASLNGKGMNKEEFDKVFDGLNNRRREVLEKVLEGEENEKIATSLHIAPTTVRKHIEKICDLFKIPRGTLKKRPSRRIPLISLFTNYKPQLLSAKTLEVPQQQEPSVEVDSIKSGISSPSEDIEALVQKVRSDSDFDKTIQDECTNLCTFNLGYIPMKRNLTRMYVQTKLNESQGLGSSEFSQERQLSNEIVLKYPKLIVLGKPGAGKTTLLQYIALNCDEIEFQSKLVPIFISLKTLAENPKRPDEIDILRYIQNKYCCSNVSQQELESLLNHGRLLFLLDGLDELTAEKIIIVNTQIHKLIDSNNRFIISCRKEFQAYQSKKFARFIFVKIADFDRTQRDYFIEKWFDEVVVIAQQRSVKANDLIKKLERPENKRIRELADTPLLLHLICLIFQERGDLPSKRVDLYREAIDLLLKNWNQFNERLHIDVVELKTVLRRIAAITFEAGKSYFEEAEISPLIANCSQTLYTTEVLSGLIVKKGWRQYAFSHQTFQEYLTAEELVSSQQGFQQLVFHINEARWREIFLQALEMLSVADSLLQLIKQQVDMLMITDKKLLEFLRWVSKKSNSVNVSYKPAAVRLFYLTRARAIAMASDPDCAVGSAIGSLIEVTTTNTIATGLDIDINTRTNLDIAIDYISAIVISRAIGTNTAINIINPDVILNVITRNMDELLKENTNHELNEAIEKFKNYLPISNRDTFREWWLNNGLEWTKNLRDVIIQYRNIGQDWQFTESQKELLVQYYQANKFLMECLNSGCNVSPEVRSHIEDHLFLPLDSSLS
jgi:predicted NACHT family NTPase